jgi:hypothetical protein
MNCPCASSCCTVSVAGKLGDNLHQLYQQLRRGEHDLLLSRLCGRYGRPKGTVFERGRRANDTTIHGLRLFVPAVDLPQSDHTPMDGVVRTDRLLFVLPDGKEASPSEICTTEN